MYFRVVFNKLEFMAQSVVRQVRLTNIVIYHDSGRK